MKLLTSSIVELQELIHEQALLLAMEPDVDERERIQSTLNQLWAINKGRASRMSTQ